MAVRGQRGHRACNTHLSSRAQAEGPHVSPRDLSPRHVGYRTVSPLGSCALAVLGPGARTWTPEATGPGSGSFPVMGSVPSLSLDSPLRAKCLLCSPLPPNGEAPWAVRQPQTQKEYKNILFFIQLGGKRRLQKAGGPIPAPPSACYPVTKQVTPTPRHRLPLEVTDVSVRILYPLPRPPPPRLCHRILFRPRWSSGPGGPVPTTPGLGLGAGSLGLSRRL